MNLVQEFPTKQVLSVGSSYFSYLHIHFRKMLLFLKLFPTIKKKISQVHTVWNHKTPLLQRVCSVYGKALKGKMLNVAWTINSHGRADGVVGSRSWYLVMRKEGQRFMIETRKQRAIHCHIRKNKCCSLLGTGRKEIGGSWHELSNFLLVLTFWCNDWEDEGSAPDGGPK